MKVPFPATPTLGLISRRMKRVILNEDELVQRAREKGESAVAWDCMLCFLDLGLEVAAKILELSILE